MAGKRAVAAPPDGRRRTWYVRKAEELRMSGHVTQEVLASDAGVSSDTVGRVEHGLPVSRLKAVMVFDALNKLNGGKLKVGRHVTSKKPTRRK
jgi:DNA-binding XRE family transcriptional regulator